MEAVIVLPNQLFEENPLIQYGRKVYLIEEYLFFKHYRFHKQKLAFHRASMKAYEAFLKSKKVDVCYVSSSQPNAEIRTFIFGLNATVLYTIDPVDNYLNRRIREGCKKKGIELVIKDSPAFLEKEHELSDFFSMGKKKYFQTEFYIQQRKKWNVLIDAQEKPVGDKWTFDAENRKKYPSKAIPPSIEFPDDSVHYKEAVKYVNEYFPNNPGKLSQKLLYPVDYWSAKKWLAQFLRERFAAFGTYEDAIVAKQSIIHHSVLSPLLNAGLLTPGYIIDQIIAFAETNPIELNNVEGIIRQIIGWREFIRGVYTAKGSQERTTNFWGFKRKLPDSFYSGTTGILPIDVTINKLLKTGYNHHIERLMVLGNFMLLCEFDPDEVYRWFMEMYIDAYDWVMVPNVYGMSQFADGGLMPTKPYISGSNYLMKMSDFPKGDWQQVWDGLFWRFMHVHRNFFLSNPRLGMLVRTFDKMDIKKQHAHLTQAEKFISML